MTRPAKSLRALAQDTGPAEVPAGFPTTADAECWARSRVPRLDALTKAPEGADASEVEQLWTEAQAIMVGMIRADLPSSRVVLSTLEALEGVVRMSRTLSKSINPPDVLVVSSPEVATRIVVTLAELCREFRPELFSGTRDSGEWCVNRKASAERAATAELRESGIPPAPCDDNATPPSSRPTLTLNSPSFDSIFQSIEDKFAEALNRGWGTQRFEGQQLDALQLLAGEEVHIATSASSIVLPTYVMLCRQHAKTDERVAQYAKRLESPKSAR